MNPDPVPPVRPLLTHVIADGPLRREAGINNGAQPIDEIANYLRGRYLSSGESAWRLLGFNITKKIWLSVLFPFICRLRERFASIPDEMIRKAPSHNLIGIFFALMVFLPPVMVRKCLLANSLTPITSQRFDWRNMTSQGNIGRITTESSRTGISRCHNTSFYATLRIRSSPASIPFFHRVANYFTSVHIKQL